MRKWIRDLARRAGWVVHRWPANRFDAMSDALVLLRAQGFDPRVIIDIGANAGAWTDLASRVFAPNQWHLVEPQTAFQASLHRFQPPRFLVHPVALTAEGHDSVWMVGAGGTGAFVASTGSAAPGVRFQATSLDALLAERVDADSHALLKLDVESHELTVLGSGTRVLSAAEVVIMEFQFFQIGDNGMPVLRDVIDFMAHRDFVLYDIAAVSARSRDQRARTGDLVFAHRSSALVADNRWV